MISTKTEHNDRFLQIINKFALDKSNKKITMKDLISQEPSVINNWLEDDILKKKKHFYLLELLKLLEHKLLQAGWNNLQKEEKIGSIVNLFLKIQPEIKVQIEKANKDLCSDESD